MKMAGAPKCQHEVAKPGPTTMLTDHVEHGEEDDQEDWNTDYFGKTAKGKRKSEGTGKGDGEACKDRFKDKCYWCEEMGHRQADASKKKAYQKQRQEPLSLA